jgi:hypothetical protein
MRYCGALCGVRALASDNLVGKYFGVLYSSLFSYCISALCIWVTVVAHRSHIVCRRRVYLVSYVYVEPMRVVIHSEYI